MEFSALHISFVAFALITLGAGLGLALSKRFIYAAFLLFALLFGVAAIFIFAGAELLAVAQLIVYVGGILILLVFGIMLTRKRISGFAETALHQSITSALVGLGTAAVLLFVFLQVDWESLDWMQKSVAVESGLNNPQMIGKQLLSSYLLPFELMGILLLLALIGAAYIAKEKA
ncbi:MAG: NADH-quinone oxidoreductase subunit J [Bacteroidota bacterium]